MQLDKIKKISLSVFSAEHHQQGRQHAPSIPVLGCRFRLPVHVPLAPPVRLPICRPDQPARALFLSLSACLPTFATYPPVPLPTVET